jgi:hypothetical protein
LSTHSFIERFISELDQAKESKPDKKERVPIPRHATWIQPSPGMAKLNVDAGLSHQGSVGAVVVVARSDASVFIGASAVRFEGISDPEVLEAMAVSKVFSIEILGSIIFLSAISYRRIVS